MRNRTGSRLVAMVACGAILLILGWRMHLLKSARPTPHSGHARAPVSGSATAASHDLAWDEQHGGHTLARHVGRSERDLALRLEHEAGVAAASSFADRATAEYVVGTTLEREQERVASWMRRSRDNLALDYRSGDGRTIGHVLLRGENHALPASDARVVLRRSGEEFFVLTAYPVEP